MDDIEQRVLEFVADQTGVKLKKLTLNTRLLHDLGVDGDDAVEFFQAYSDEFKVNIQELQIDFVYYFGSEGGGPSWIAGVAFVAGLIVADRLWRLTGFLSPAAWSAIVVVLFLVSTSTLLIRYQNRWGLNDNYGPITIKDLVDSAAAGRWLLERPWRKTYLKDAE